MAHKSSGDEEAFEEIPLTEEQIAEYREAFSVFDKDGNGQITCAELKTVLRTLGKNPTDEEVADMLESVDDNDNGVIEFNEFLHLMQKEVKALESEAMIREAFEVFDTEGDGFITIRKLKQVIQDLGCQYTDEEIDEMMELADDDGDGRVEYEGLIGLLSETNETLFSAYQKRVKREEKKRKEMAMRVPVTPPEEEPPDTQREESTPERIPDMSQIASQYDQGNYDEFSRKAIVGGKTIIKKPGKKVDMSRTRMMYLQRKNKALQTVGQANGNSMNSGTPIMSLNSSYAYGESFKTAQSPDSRLTQSSRPMTEMWLGTIHDERHQFDGQFHSKPPKQYKHVESRLKDPNYYLKKPKPGHTSPDIYRNSNRPTPRIDINKEIKELRNSNNKYSQNSGQSDHNRFPGQPMSRASRNQQHQTYTKTYKRDIHVMEKMYYSLWRTAFNNALEKLRKDKKRQIILQTPELIAEQALKDAKEHKRKTRRIFHPKPQKRLSVISPSLEAEHKKLVAEKPGNVVPVISQGSYTQRYRKLAGLEYQQIVHQQKVQPKEEKVIVAKSQKMKIEERRGDVITKSGLNRMLNIRI